MIHTHPLFLRFTSNKQLGRSVVVAAAPPAGGSASGSDVLERAPSTAAKAAIRPPSQSPPPSLPMVYLPATLASLMGRGGSKKGGGKSSSPSPPPPPSRRSNSNAQAMTIPRDLAELCGHEMRVLRWQLRASSARVLAEACFVSITVCSRARCDCLASCLASDDHQFTTPTPIHTPTQTGLRERRPGRERSRAGGGRARVRSRRRPARVGHDALGVGRAAPWVHHREAPRPARGGGAGPVATPVPERGVAAAGRDVCG